MAFVHILCEQTPFQNWTNTSLVAQTPFSRNRYKLYLYVRSKLQFAPHLKNISTHSTYIAIKVSSLHMHTTDLYFAILTIAKKISMHSIIDFTVLHKHSEHSQKKTIPTHRHRDFTDKRGRQIKLQQR